MPEAAIGLMARYPELGLVKTRLARTVGEHKAWEVYCTILGKAHELLRHLDSSAIRRAVFVTPKSDLAVFKQKYQGLDAYWEQAGRDLGRRMQNALNLLLSDKRTSKACLIGTDSPEIKATTVKVAFGFLDDHDLVLGPSLDGGYYLIGMRRVYPELFDGIKWGSDTVLEETLGIADRLHLQVALLPKLRDLDDEGDLKYFEQTGYLQD